MVGYPLLAAAAVLVLSCETCVAQTATGTAAFPENSIDPGWATSLASSLGAVDYSTAFPFPTTATTTSSSRSTSTATRATSTKTRSTSTSSPSATALAAANYITSEWNAPKIAFGALDLAFVNGQNGTGAQGDTLEVTYPAGSYSHATGGAEFDSPLSSSAGSALLTYSVYLPNDFNYVKGGKLPGFRGGPDGQGCAGGMQTDGTGCFSARIMFRPGGEGEIYAYIPVTKALCNSQDVICNSDYGTSFGRGQFSYQRGAWNNIGLYVQLNNPSNIANGVLQLYYNGLLAINFTNVEIRSSDSIANISSMMFSTFFGGGDSSWATPTEQSTYFANVSMFGSSGAATGPGSPISSSSTRHTFSRLLALVVLAIIVTGSI